MAEFDGSRVVVGANPGIGRPVAELAARSGAWVLGLSRTGASPPGSHGDLRRPGRRSGVRGVANALKHLNAFERLTILNADVLDTAAATVRPFYQQTKSTQ